MKTQETTLEALKAQIAELEALKKEEKVKKEKAGSSVYDLRTAFINKIPQGLKGRKSFMLNVVKIDVTQANVDNLINWLRQNNQDDRAEEVEENKNRFFDVSILTEDGSTEIFNSSILAFDKSNSLGKLIVKSDNGFDYYVNRMTWDSSSRELIFS